MCTPLKNVSLSVRCGWKVHKHNHCMDLGSLVPRPLPKEGRGPGIYCLRMRETTPGFYGGSYNSVPYRRLYLWTVRERPFYCLGVALRVRPPGCESVCIYSFPPPSSTLG